jgi:nucleotide-binding universal stress UspA family protein
VSDLVVGVDGSEQARRALAWAVEEAAAHGVELRAVFVYPPGDETSPYVRSYAFIPDAAAADLLYDDEQRWREERATEAREHAERLVRGEVEAVLAGRDDVRVTTDVIADERPARALINAAERARGLIVGSRGRGGFAGLLLGSVSQQLAQHAPCPVTIVPMPRSED